MKGTRPLDNDEIRSVSTCFTGTFAVRNRGLFMLGVSTGGRISELLSLTIGDVYQNRSRGHRPPVRQIHRQRRRGIQSRTCEHRRHASHRRSGTLASGAVPNRESQPSPIPFAKRQRIATHDASSSTQRAKRRFRGCWTQRTSCNPFFAKVVCPKVVRADG